MVECLQGSHWSASTATLTSFKAEFYQASTFSGKEQSQGWPLATSGVLLREHLYTSALSDPWSECSGRGSHVYLSPLVTRAQICPQRVLYIEIIVCDPILRLPCNT